MVFLMVILVKSSPSLQKMKIKKMKSKWSYLLMKKKLCINEMNMTIDRKSTRLNSSHVSISSVHTLSLHDALPILRASSDRVYRIGDKVIQLVNQPEDGVFNGDIGEIVAIFTEDENKENEEQMVVSFDEKEVVYKRNEYDH